MRKRGQIYFLAYSASVQYQATHLPPLRDPMRADLTT